MAGENMEGEKNVLKNMETFLIALIGLIIMILLALIIRLFIKKYEM
jgi:lipopolysaccharide/colanic/teichoic acid biosynthesis glycosyltransferase